MLGVTLPARLRWYLIASLTAGQIAFDQVPPNDPELRAFLQDAGNDQARERLSEPDLEMVRVIEDLVDVLIGKNVFNFTDLPRIAQKKLLNRRQLRRNLSVLTNLVGNADDIF